ncbi:unnamed protein product [Paramecium sonneborni]|uniref:Uncharacterized protein n=1 Tax=Paramecium sonneborni TaxID=65129 RepID=A0A8S1LM74_9CILI|nr:unnamed protein product [Paramecium sonneborni]
MLVRTSLSPRRKCFTPSMWEGRQQQTIRRSQNRYLKTEDVDNRNVQSRNDDSKRKSGSIVNNKKNKSMTNHKASLNSSFNTKNIKTIQLSTRKSSLQNKLHPNSTTSENHVHQYFSQSPAKRILNCEKLIKAQKFQEALKDLEEIDQPQINPEYIKEIAYYKGLIHMNCRHYDQAVNQFSRARQSGDLNGNTVILQALCLKKIGNYSDAIVVLKEFLSKKYSKLQPTYYDALIHKGKLLMKIKKYQLALQDFNQASVLENDQISFQGTLGRADCLRLSGKITEALNVYETIPENEIILMRKIYCYIELQSLDRAMEAINQILLSDPNSSEALFMKGQIYINKGQLNEAILSFEQSIKQNNSRKAVTKSLQEIAKIKIDQKDFYSAYYTLQREDHLEVDKESIMKLRQFTEGVIFLMKRKYQEGVNVFTQLINNYQLGEFIKKIIFLYRAYGFICLNKFQKALNDLIYVQNFQELDQPSLYNKIVCEGIVMSQSSQFEKAQSQFQKASKLFPGKMEPHFYKSLTLIQFINKHMPKDKDKYIKNALKHLDKAVTLNDQNSNLLYHRGILRFYFGQIDLALSDLTKAVEKNEDRVAKYVYARGLVRACLDNPQQALNDFTIVINWDSKFAEAYLNRAKVFTLLGDRTAAFNDLQTYISLKPKDPDIHLWAGNLLFLIGAYEHAIKTYSHSPDIQNNVQLLRYRALCYIIQKELNYAMSDLNRIIELTGDKKSYIDKECLLALKTSTVGPDESQSVMVVKLSQGSNKLINFRLASQMLKKLIILGSDGHVFLTPDLIFYRGIMKFYLGNYKKAIDLWTKSYGLKQQIKEFSQQSNNSLISQQEQQERLISELDELEFEDRTYNMYEYYYNVALATILNKQKRKGKELLNQLADQLQESFETAIRDFISALDSNQSKTATIFPFSNRLCCIFPTFKMGNLETRLSFCLPRITPPSMNPEFDNKLIEGIQSTDVDNKPEAPWIRRNPDGVIFTENVQQVELDLRSESQKSQIDHNQQEENDDENSEQHQISINDEKITIEQRHQDDSTTYQTNYKKDIELLKQQLRLDKIVEQRLAKLK